MCTSCVVPSVLFGLDTEPKGEDPKWEEQYGCMSYCVSRTTYVFNRSEAHQKLEDAHHLGTLMNKHVGGHDNPVKTLWRIQSGTLSFPGRAMLLQLAQTSPV